MLAVTAVLGGAALGGGLIGCGGNDDDSEDTGTDAGGGSDEAVAQDAKAKAAALTAQTTLEVYFTETATYDGATPEELAKLDPAIAEADVTVTAKARNYELTVKSESGNTFTLMRNADGPTTKSCETEGEGGCPDGGQW